MVKKEENYALPRRKIPELLTKDMRTHRDYFRKRIQHWESANLIHPKEMEEFDIFLQYLDHLDYDEYVGNGQWLTSYRLACEYEDMLEQKEKDLEREMFGEVLLSDEERKKIEQKARREERFQTPKLLWKEVFNYYSVCNDVIGETIYHAFLSLICKLHDIQISVCQRKFHPITHVFGIQNSGSGKDQSLLFLRNLVKRYNEKVMKYNHTAEKKLKLIRYYTVSGSESPETYLNSWELDSFGKPLILCQRDNKKRGVRKGQFYPQVKGIFERSDLITATECSFLFRADNNSSRQSKQEMFLQALEGTPIKKELRSWVVNGQSYPTTTNFNGVFVGMSRPVQNMKEHLANSGLQQRALNWCRKLTVQDRIRMHKELSKLWIIQNTEAGKRKIEQREDELAQALLQVSLTLQKRKPTLQEEHLQEIVSLVNDKLHEWTLNVMKDVPKDEHQEVINSFVSRYRKFIDAMAFHNATSRGSLYIEVSDYQAAIELLGKCFEKLKEWVEENVETNVHKEIKQEHDLAKVRAFLKKLKEPIQKSALVKFMKAQLEKSTSSAYRWIDLWVERGVIIKKECEGKEYYTVI